MDKDAGFNIAYLQAAILIDGKDAALAGFALERIVTLDWFGIVIQRALNDLLTDYSMPGDWRLAGALETECKYLPVVKAEGYSQLPSVRYQDAPIFAGHYGYILVRIIDFLTVDPSIDRETLYHLVPAPENYFARAVNMGCKLGLLSKSDRNTVTLAPNWQSIVDPLS